MNLLPVRRRHMHIFPRKWSPCKGEDRQWSLTIDHGQIWFPHDNFESLLSRFIKSVRHFKIECGLFEVNPFVGEEDQGGVQLCLCEVCDGVVRSRGQGGKPAPTPDHVEHELTFFRVGIGGGWGMVRKLNKYRNV